MGKYVLIHQAGLVCGSSREDGTAVSTLSEVKSLSAFFAALYLHPPDYHRDVLHWH